MKVLIVATILLCICHQTLSNGCTRPAEVVKFEADCFKQHGGIVDKIQQTATGLFATAKKKLGIVTREDEHIEESPKRNQQKCEYYQCVLSKMAVINEHNLPDLSLTVTSIKKYSDDLDPAKCFETLISMLGINHIERGSSSILETHINGESEEVFVSGGGLTVLTHDDNPMAVDHEVACELAADLVKCLSKQSENGCPIFQYP